MVSIKCLNALNSVSMTLFHLLNSLYSASFLSSLSNFSHDVSHSLFFFVLFVLPHQLCSSSSSSSLIFHCWLPSLNSTHNPSSLLLYQTGSATRQEEGDDQELLAHHTGRHWQWPQLHLRGQQPGGADGQTSHCHPQRPPYVAFVPHQSLKVHRQGSGDWGQTVCV